MTDLDQLLTEYYEWLAVERGLAPNSLQAYRRDLRRYAAYLAAQGVTDPAAIGEHTVHGYVAHLEVVARRRRPARSSRRRRSPGRSWRCARSTGSARARATSPTDPSEEVGAPRVPAGHPEGARRGAGDRLLGAVEGDAPRAQRDRALLELLYATGIRISEAVGLDLETSISKTASCACSARATRNGSFPSAAPRAPRSSRTSATGRLALRNGALAPSRRHRCGVPQRTRDAPLAAGVLDDRAARGRAGRACASSCHRTSCGTRARRTCSITVPTSASCRSCSATPRSRPRRCTPRCRRSGSGRSTKPRIHARRSPPDGRTGRGPAGVADPGSTPAGVRFAPCPARRTPRARPAA